MNADEKKIAGILQRLPSGARGPNYRSGCPNEETLAVFLSGDLPRDARDEVEVHLAQCSSCIEDLVAACKSGELAGIETVPQRLIESAMRLVKEREMLFNLVVRLARGSIELIRTSGRLMLSPSPVLRGEVRPAEANSLQVEQEVGRFRIAVELDLSEAGMCQVVANVREETGELAEGVRLSLSSGDREQASFLTRAGTVVFDRIAPGEYSIAVSESGAVVGKIKLSLMM